MANESEWKFDQSVSKSLKVIDHVKGMSRFQYYQDGNLWYKTDTELFFPVPLTETGSARFLEIDKSSIFMRWIRKHLDTINVGRLLNE